MVIRLLVLVILIFVNAFFAASEIALLSLNDNKLSRMADEGNKKARLLIDLTREPSRFLATIQIGITLAGFLASAFASESFAGPIVTAIMGTGVSLPEPLVKTITMIVITLILSYFTLVFGELVPKRLAMKKAGVIARGVVGPLTVLAKIASPFVRLLTASTNLAVRLFGVDPDADDEPVSEDDIRLMVDIGGEKGTILEDEKEMINNIFEFDNKMISSIMTHRTDIAALPLDAGLADVVAFIQSTKFSRIPVYDETIDDIAGILYTSHLVQYLAGEHDPADFKLADLIVEPYTVPEFKRTDELFREMNQRKVHFAVVIDEYGGTAGIVTNEDLIEEIVGEIYDERDTESADITIISTDIYRISGSASLYDVQKRLGTPFPVDEFDTLNGFMVDQLGRIPNPGESITLKYEDICLTVETTDGKKILEIIAEKCE